MSAHVYVHPGDIPVDVLATLASRLLIDPLSEAHGPWLDDLDRPEAAALNVLLGALRIAATDFERVREAQVRVLDEISRLLKQHTLAPKKRKEAIDRLGDRGLLSLTEYSVEFSTDWRQFELLFNERRNSISEIVKAPSAYVHLM